MLGIDLHNSLNSFRVNRGGRTGIMEAKLAQQLAFIEKYPLYSNFIDLWNDFGAIDRGRCLNILYDCGVGENDLCLMLWF